MEPITKFSGKVMPLPVRDVDTDQIIPARFLKTIDKQGLGINLFNDWRYLASGEPNPDFVLNKPASQGATVLLAGDNFGCGSSREHAPWALMGWGFRAVLSTSFADIFKGNCLKNGLLPIVIDEATEKELFAAAQSGPIELTVDLESQTITLPSGRAVEFPIDTFSKNCLLAGVDQLGYIQNQMPAIEAYEQRVGDRVLSV
ncbi:MAG: 3-isopropylmalate dehydratase small subunit [Bryobacterales bacterium]|nr:3-isopropylmalate dehydratase small subunit [Acidobacteriota bacterium]MCB9384235.1 3-isopropylmalate dehydratase small subunit [Bryobacterales bacterium]